jgi:uncharacterized membrane protein
MVVMTPSTDTITVEPYSGRFLRESALTRYAAWLSVLGMAATTAFLVWRYSSLPDILPVHFRGNGSPNGWQFRTIPRVFVPVFVQFGIFVAGTSVGTLLLSRKDATTATLLPDARAAVTATEAIMLMSATWVVVQSYTAYALVRLWSGVGSSLGVSYTALEVAAVVATAAIGVRAQKRLSRPAPLPYIPAHWRLGQLYCNAEDPALFVPTRDGRRWTLNFGRPAAALLLGGILIVGIVAPTVMLAITLR